MGHVTAVMLGERSISIVSGRPAAGGIELIHATTVPLPDDYADRDATGRAAAIKAAFDATLVDVRTITLVVPRPLAILRQFTLPPGTAEERHQMIRFQLEKEMPVPLDQVRHSYVLTDGADGRVRVSSAAVPADALERLTAPLAAAGARVVSAVVGTFGLVHAVPPGDGAALVVSLADRATEVAVIDGGVPVITRSTPGIDLDAIATEIERATRSFAASGGEVKRVYVAGEGEAAAALAGELKTRLEREVTTLIPNGTLTKKPEVTIDPATAAAAGVCAAMLRGKPAPPDVLHPPAAGPRFRLTKTSRIAIVAIVAVVGLITASQVALAGQRAKVRDLKAELDKYKPSADKLNRMRAQGDVLDLWMDHRHPWADLFDALRVPREGSKLYFEAIDMSEPETLTLAGKAIDDKSITHYISELQKVKAVFREVRLTGSTSNTDPGAYKKNFSIGIKLAGVSVPPKK